MNFETIMFFLFDMYKHVFMRKDIALKIVYLIKFFSFIILEVPKTGVLEKSLRFLTLDLKTKLITSESTFRRSLRRIVVYKMLQ